MFRLGYYFIKYCLYKAFWGFYSLGWRVGFSRGVTIINAPYISLGYRIYLDTNVVLQIPGQLFEKDGEPKLVIKNFVTIGMGSIISAAKKITIENDVLIGPFCYMADHQYAYKDTTKSIRYQGFDLTAPIHIKKGAWIGTKVTICPGVTIGKNSVVGANSVVTRDVPDFAVAVGTPARVVKQYDKKEKKWINVHSNVETDNDKIVSPYHPYGNNQDIAVYHATHHFKGVVSLGF